jgi:hypothetical protein
VIRAPRGATRTVIDNAMLLRLASGLDGYAVGLSAVDTVAEDVSPDTIDTALRVIDRFGKTLRRVQRLIKQTRDDQE